MLLEFYFLSIHTKYKFRFFLLFLSLFYFIHFFNFSQPGQDIHIQDETVYLQVDMSEDVSVLLKEAENDLSASSSLLYQADVCFIMLTGPKQAIFKKRYMEKSGLFLGEGQAK